MMWIYFETECHHNNMSMTSQTITIFLQSHKSIEFAVELSKI